jgi:hypothetical protein
LVASAPLQDRRALLLARPQVAGFHSAVQLQLLPLPVRPPARHLVSVRPQGRLRGLLPPYRNLQAEASPSVRPQVVHQLLPLQSLQPLVLQVDSRLVVQVELAQQHPVRPQPPRRPSVASAPLQHPMGHRPPRRPLVASAPLQDRLVLRSVELAQQHPVRHRPRRRPLVASALLQHPVRHRRRRQPSVASAPLQHPVRHRPLRRPLVASAPLQDRLVLRSVPRLRVAGFHSAVQLQLQLLPLPVHPPPPRLVLVRPQGRLRELLPPYRNLQAEASPSVRPQVVHRAQPARLLGSAASTHRHLVALVALLVCLRPSRLEELLAPLQQGSNNQRAVCPMRSPSVALNQVAVVAEALRVLGEGGGVAAEAGVGEVAVVLEWCNEFAMVHSDQCIAPRDPDSI